MGCGCGRNKGVRGVGSRPIVAPRIKSTQPRPAASRPKVQAQNIEKPNSNDKRAIEKKRREDILRRLGRL